MSRHSVSGHRQAGGGSARAAVGGGLGAGRRRGRVLLAEAAATLDLDGEAARRLRGAVGALSSAAGLAQEGLVRAVFAGGRFEGVVCRGGRRGGVVERERGLSATIVPRRRWRPTELPQAVVVQALCDGAGFSAKAGRPAHFAPKLMIGKNKQCTQDAFKAFCDVLPSALAFALSGQNAPQLLFTL